MERVLLTLTQKQLDKVRFLAQEEHIPLQQIDPPTSPEDHVRVSRLINILEEVGSMLVQIIKDREAISDKL